MDSALVAFQQAVFGDLIEAADPGSPAILDAFFERFTEYLIGAGEIEVAGRVGFVGPRGIRVDGYGGDPIDNNATLTLFILDFEPYEEIETLTQTELDAILKRLLNFLTRSLEVNFREGLGERTEAYRLASLIAARWERIEKIRLFVLSNRRLSDRVDSLEKGDLQGRQVTYNVWDIGRLHRYVASGREHEPIEMDLVAEFGSALQALPASIEGAEYDGYLAVIPGDVLAKIYDKYDTRLLEQNVRVYLQARGRVNQGIKVTIENDPTMFFAYNNGLSATAEVVRTRRVGGVHEITHITNLQIVNGGQTTASIHSAYRRKIDLSRVFVQMKISIVPTDRAADVVPNISKYANSQNTIKTSDFFGLHEYHRTMEKFSRRLVVGSADGGVRETKWYYERVRGQYAEERSRRTLPEQRRFDAEYPRTQVISKTDHAKYENVWRKKPHIVCHGAQKNLAEFAGSIAGLWDTDSTQINEHTYRQAIARAIIFRSAEKIVTDQDWYEGGYRAPVVAYAIAKLADGLERLGQTIDIARIWRTQRLSAAFEDALAESATAVVDVLSDPQGARNISEWAKQEECWRRVRLLRIDWSPLFLAELIDPGALVEQHGDAKETQRMDNGIEAQTKVVEIGAVTWRNILNWARDRRLLSERDEGILMVAAQMPQKYPSEKQSIAALNILDKLRAQGCRLA